MGSYHKDVINFGQEEANRMAAIAEDPRWKNRAETWLRTVTGQEFLDSVIWGEIGMDSVETLNALLKEFGATTTIENRRELLKIADNLIVKEGY